VSVRVLLLAALTLPLAGCSFDEILADPQPTQVVYVGEPVYVHTFDPYYNRPKYYVQPAYYTESTSKKTRGNKTFKTTTVRNEYGQTVYKNTTVKKKKK